MKSLAAIVIAALLPVLGACDHGRAPQPDASAGASKPAPDTAIGRSVEKAMDQARTKLATENIDLTSFNVSGNHRGIVITADDHADDTRPKAEITPQGDLLIAGRKVDANAEQHALLLQYRKQIEGIASAGMDIGVQGADLGMKAASEAIKGIFSGNPGDVEQRVEAEADEIRLAARKLCDRLPAMLETQTALAAAMPEFRPYATMEQDDIDDCYDDDLDAAQVRKQVQRQTREEIRTGIRNTIQAATRGTRVAPENAETNAAAEADEAADNSENSSR